MVRHGALFARAILYQENGAPEKAIPMLRQVLEMDPSRQRTAGYQLAMALEQVGDSEEANKVMTEVRRRQDVELITKAIESQKLPAELVANSDRLQQTFGWKPKYTRIEDIVRTAWEFHQSLRNQPVH